MGVVAGAAAAAGHAPAAGAAAAGAGAAAAAARAGGPAAATVARVCVLCAVCCVCVARQAEGAFGGGEPPQPAAGAQAHLMLPHPHMLVCAPGWRPRRCGCAPPPTPTTCRPSSRAPSSSLRRWVSCVGCGKVEELAVTWLAQGTGRQQASRVRWASSSTWQGQHGSPGPASPAWVAEQESRTSLARTHHVRNTPPGKTAGQQGAAGDEV